jgi:hypothetical protein
MASPMREQASINANQPFSGSNCSPVATQSAGHFPVSLLHAKA